MAQRRTVDLLPEIFRTDTNKKFLSATLDQLTQEPNFKRIQGYVGRRVGPGVNPADNYIVEPTSTRTNYQVEPGVVLFKTDTNTAIDAITYPGMIDALDMQGAVSERQDRLWSSEYYTWDPFCDLDKFTNYSQYYWLPNGPDSVDVASQVVPLTDGWEIDRVDNLDFDVYQFSDVAGNNPIITLVRGGNYTFDVNQPGHNFWIQSVPGVSGTLPSAPNISSRDVLGVTNNGEDVGRVTFNVPLKTAQDFYYTLADAGTVDLISPLKLTDINNVYVDQFLAKYPNGIDGITNLDNRTVVFTNRIADTQDGGWQLTSQYDPVVRTSPNQVSEWGSWDVDPQPWDDQEWVDPEVFIVSGSPDPLDGTPGSYDSLTYDKTINVADLNQRYGVWRIQYIAGPDGRKYMTLSPIRNIDTLSKFRVLFGTRWSNTQWYKDAVNNLQQVPLLTAVLDTLWYQDSTNPDIFGQIRLIDSTSSRPVDINDIIGAKNYTSPNGVVFTNGLKVQFRGLVKPSSYQNLEYYVEGVGTGPGIVERVGFIDGEAYFGPYHVYNGQKMTGSMHSTTVFQQYIYNTIEESLANRGAGGPEGAPLPQASITGAERGNGIRLLPVTDFITPEVYIDESNTDSIDYDPVVDIPEVPDYLTINRASRDLNAWTRSNRWFHIDVINATAQYNNTTAILDNNLRGKRPIIEFRAGLELYNFGTQSKIPVDVIDFSASDALSLINGQRGYGVDGYTFVEGTKVIFAADTNASVRNQIYEVRFISPDTIEPVIVQPIIDLVPVEDGLAQIDQTVVCTSGNTLRGVSFWFDGVAWQRAQQKTGVNQAPLFDIHDVNGVSYGDKVVYPSTTFAGSKLFGYAVGGTDITDSILGFALKYLNISNVGDILFENYFYTDKFIYVRDNVSVDLNASDGYVRQYFDRTGFSSLVGWQTAAAEDRSRQVFRFNYDGITPLIMDVPPARNTVFPVLQVYVDGQFYDPTKYTLTSTNQSTTIVFDTEPGIGSIIEAQIISDVASKVAYYQIPSNLEHNPLNENSPGFTLGTIRNHYNSIGQNLKGIQGPINGANNSRDLGDIIRYGTLIVQQSCPMTLTGIFLRRQQYELFSSLRFNSQEYEKYKSLLLDLASKGDFINSTSTQVLDSVLAQISAGKNSLSPFYWSDMIPSGETYTEVTYTISPITTPVFDLNSVYDFTTSNYQGLLVYLNGTLLLKDVEYTVGIESPTVTITATLTTGDVLKIREYATTYGSFVPNTPTKMGLYPAFRPAIFEDRTTNGSVLVIQGHDGSITRAFGDSRDDVLLEFETRIFDNLKIDTPIPLSATEVIPGQFRTTDYTLAEINNILGADFLSWVGWNKLDYTTQYYQADNPFSWNYSQSGDRLDGTPLLGAWRGIFQYFYDTVTPSTTPWEMLGISEEPTWWVDEYGPGPYTSGNMVLWGDLEQGLVRDPNGEYIKPAYARPGLSLVIPVDSEGNLLNPWDAVVGNYDATSYRRSWTFGDGGPVESAWRTSSGYPFALMRLLALTKPAKFFSLFADRDRYVFKDDIGQYLWDDRYRLDAKHLDPLYGDGTSKASYINWIIDYNRRSGTNGTADLTNALTNTGVRLCWRMAGFSDKNYLKIYSEAGAPNSTNTSLMLPDESYQLLLYKNQPFERITYSSVIVQKTETGYAVLGYSTARPFFEILVSRPAGLSTNITVGAQTVRVPVEYYDNVVQVPYNYVFTNETAVCDFLLSYGKLLERQGLIFENRENGYILDWNQMCSEFLYWSQQGWSDGSMINLNPAATRISIERPNAVVDSIANPGLEQILLDQDRLALSMSDLVIDRLDNLFRVTTQTSRTINFIDLRFTAYEHIAILDNVSIFADLLYDPVTGARQSRFKVSGYLSGAWTGLVNAPGFVLNENNVQEWVPTRRYPKGEIVKFKGEYWSAADIVQPSQVFNFEQWIKSDYDEIMVGLLPNASNSSNQLSQSYSIYDANLEGDTDLFSYGLIGFRPRDYMQALNLDDISQVGLYQQFLGSKGTIRSAELFSYANLGKETAQYDIYEYWGILKSQYGATDNRRYVELLLNEANLKSDPTLIEVIDPGQASRADQTVLIGDIWKSSYKINSPVILPTTTIPITDVGLPSAGYPSLDDVDLTMFSLDDPQSLVDNIDDIGVGTRIWVAKTNSYEWDVYRAETITGTITSIADNLNGRALVKFSQAHGLAVGDYLIIKYFTPSVNGVYRVQAVPGIYGVLIDYVFTGGVAATTGTGLGFTLRSARINQPSDIINLPYVTSLRSGARVWVDNLGVDPISSPGLPTNRRGPSRWGMLEKINPFEEIASLDPETLTTSPDQRFGSSIAQGFRSIGAIVGAPGYSNGAGCLYTFVKETSGKFVQDVEVQTLNAPATSGFGNAVDVGDQTWAAAGASLSNENNGYVLTLYKSPLTDVIEQTQLLVSPDADFDSSEFGYAVAISRDENWMYVGAPGVNKVYVFSRVDHPVQSVTYNTTAGATDYSFSGQIQIDNPLQLSVVLNNVLLSFANGDYSVSLDSDSITLSQSPGNNFPLIITRNVGYQLDTFNYYRVAGTSSDGTGAEFDVNVVRGSYSPVLSVVNGVTQYGSGYVADEIITIPGSAIGGIDGTNDLDIKVTQTGPNYTTSVNTSTDPFAVTSTIIMQDATGLEVGQELHYIAGSATTMTGSTIVAINGLEVTVTGAIQSLIDVGNPYPVPSLALPFTFFVSPNYISVYEVAAGQGDSTQSTFNLSDYLYTVGEDDIFSFTVRVNGQIYRPFIDYYFEAGDIIFDNAETFPGKGALIFVYAKDYWTPVELLTNEDINPDARFGHSLATTTDGRQVLVGAPNTTVDVPEGDINVPYPGAGMICAYDRSAQRFQVVDPEQMVYTTTLELIGPTRVSLNGVFLQDAAQYPFDAQFEVIDTNTITLLGVTLAIGDTLVVETNQFNLIENIVADIVQRNSNFGWSVDQCINNCSFYVGAPYNSLAKPAAGLVEFHINQSRAYGQLVTQFANPSLSIGDAIRVNNTFVVSTGTTVAELVVDINATIDAGLLPNVTARTTPDLTLIGDGVTATFDVGSIYSDAGAVVNTLVLVNDTVSTNYTYNSETQQITFFNVYGVDDTLIAAIPEKGAVITVVSGRIIFSVLNPNSTLPLDKLEVAPGSGNLFDDLGIITFAHQQNITSPVPQDNANFGKSVFISDNSAFLAVGAPNGSTVAPNTFDKNTTTFDARSTNITSMVQNSGAVYVYDFLPSTNASVDNPGQWAFGQQIYDQALLTVDSAGDFVGENDAFGTAINFTSGALLVGSPYHDLVETNIVNYGRLSQFENVNLEPAWSVKRIQNPVVDIAMMNTVFMYDRVTGVDKQYFDYFDPLQGRMLGVVQQNIDFVGAVDPAAYNVGEFNNYGTHWARARVGQIWWDTTNVRFIDPNQDDIVYASRRWGQLFPGSVVNVYQWVESTVPPIGYTGPGTVRTTTSYTTTVSVNEQGLLVTSYYFWVSGIRSVDKVAKKTLSIETLTRYIENPRASGIAYIAAIDASTIAIYNGLEYISAEDTILHVEFDQKLNEAAVHVEYQLIAQDREDGILTGTLYQKLIDSFSGVDVVGHPVPDPFLSPGDRYGVLVRPRQSFFRNRFSALENYLTRSNEILAQYPISETRRFNLLNSADPEPSESSGAWDKRLANYEELTYQNLVNVPLGYKYLVASDATNSGLWTIYEVIQGPAGTRTTTLIRVQNYDTPRYWNRVNWYRPGYNPSVNPVAEVPNYSALSSIAVPVGSSVKVTANAQGKFEIYRLDNTANGQTWTRVALQDGTIEFLDTLWDYRAGNYGFDAEVFDAQYFDKEPTIETRKIIQAINEELFVDDLALARNQVLVLMFNYILQEQEAPTWLSKTSLITVNHTIRELAPYQIYQKDNQDFVLNYIQEVKPYHVQIREFNLKYLGSDLYQGSATDFDLPAFWNPAENIFVSPVLDDNGTLSTTSSYPSSSEVWQTFPWNQWYENYLLSIEAVEIVDSGMGYMVPPVITVIGECLEPAEMTARINSQGQVVAIDVVNPGLGYRTAATIVIESGIGAGAIAVAIMGNNLVRSVKTVMKYDRYEYQSDVTMWEPNVIYNNGDLVRYVDRVWAADSVTGPTVISEEFDPNDWFEVPAEYLSGVDRTYGFYAPGPNEPGLDLALLISGLDYPGVQVYGPNFNQNTGFDVGNYDINPYDNISYGAEGRPTYDPAILDAIYESKFTDPYIGVGVSAINVDGGQFVDTYSSHAPEELVPGAIFDTLDIRVITTPGSDWSNDGHGFALNAVNYEFDSSGDNSYSFDGLVTFPVVVRVINKTTQIELTNNDFTVDWIAKTISITPSVVDVITGDILWIFAYEMGGGNQMYRNSYTGIEINNGVTVDGTVIDNAVIVPVSYDLLNNVVIFVNGQQVTDFTYDPLSMTDTLVLFDSARSETDYVFLTALALTDETLDYSWSTPVIQYLPYTGSDVWTLENSMSGTNPDNVVVEINGIRARPNEGAEYIGTGSIVNFNLPDYGRYDQAIIDDEDVTVYIDGVRLTLGIDYTVSPPVEFGIRYVIFPLAPDIGSKILITVMTFADYFVEDNTLTWNGSSSFQPTVGDTISIMSWNDTSQQDLFTQVFVGPTTVGPIGTNYFPIGRLVTDGSRLMVSRNGYWLAQQSDFVLETDFVTSTTAVVILGELILDTDVIVITTSTMSVLPGSIGFGIFQDMRGTQSSYRTLMDTTTTLSQDLLSTDTVIHVTDARYLNQPDLANGIFGQITIGGERITYRTRNLESNTLSGLRRGVAGTAAADHLSGAQVYDMSRGNQLPREYQDRIDSQNFLGDDSTTIFVADTIAPLTDISLITAVQVYVGGFLQTEGYTVISSAPITVEFDAAPANGYQVSVQVRRGLSWYQSGIDTASDGVALQDTNTPAARFIKGE